MGKDDFRMREALACSEAKEMEVEERKKAEIQGREGHILAQMFL